MVMVMVVVVEHPLAEALVLAERRRRRERLSALGALDLLPAVGVHPLVPAEVRELCICLKADLALERLHRRVDVLVLLQAGRRGERLAAVGARVRPGADVRRTDVALQVAWVGERLVAVFAGERRLLLLPARRAVDAVLLHYEPISDV